MKQEIPASPPKLILVTGRTKGVKSGRSADFFRPRGRPGRYSRPCGRPPFFPKNLNDF